MNRVSALTVVWSAAAGMDCVNAHAENFLDKLKKQVDAVQQQTQGLPVVGALSGINWSGTYKDCHKNDWERRAL